MTYDVFGGTLNLVQSLRAVIIVISYIYSARLAHNKDQQIRFSYYESVIP